MGDPAIERQACVIAVVDPVPGIVGVGGSRADLDVRAEAGAAVGAERPPELRVIVHDPVGVARAPAPRSLRLSYQTTARLPVVGSSEIFGRNWLLAVVSSFTRTAALQVAP